MRVLSRRRALSECRAQRRDRCLLDYAPAPLPPWLAGRAALPTPEYGRFRARDMVIYRRALAVTGRHSALRFEYACQVFGDKIRTPAECRARAYERCRAADKRLMSEVSSPAHDRRVIGALIDHCRAFGLPPLMGPQDTFTMPRSGARGYFSPPCLYDNTTRVADIYISGPSHSHFA